jgi:hypothetical protein
MFQSIKYTKYLGYSRRPYGHDEAEYELKDSNFSCVVVDDARASWPVLTDIVIKEYSKRNLNVATNLIRYFRFYEKRYGYSIAGQIEWAERYQPLFTPQIKADLTKYLTLI